MNDIDDILQDMERIADKKIDDTWWAVGRKLEKAYQAKVADKHPEWTRKQVNARANELTAKQQGRIRGNSKNRVTHKKMEQKTREEIERDY